MIEYYYLVNYAVYVNNDVKSNGHKVFKMSKIGVDGASKIISDIQQSYRSKLSDAEYKNSDVLITNIINLDKI